MSAESGTAIVSIKEYSQEQVDLLKRTICKDATNDEFQLFLNQCVTRKLNPFTGQIHAVKRWVAKDKKYTMAIQTGIDGLRLIAQRSHGYEGQTPPQWCGPEGVWVDVWLKKEAPAAAKIGVWRKGFREPLYAVAVWAEYAQTYVKDNQTHLMPQWRDKPALMLAKCAEALALRKGFPEELSGVYIEEEGGDQILGGELPNRADVEKATHEAEEAKRFKHLRATLNKTLSECKAEKEFRAACMAFQKDHGVQIWEEYTRHNGHETFRRLADEHHGRILEAKGSEARNSERVDEWKAEMNACADKVTWETLEKEYQETPKLRDSQLCADLLHAKGVELGILEDEQE